MLQKLFAIWYPAYLRSQPAHEPYLRFIIGLSHLGGIVQIIYLVLNIWKGLPLAPTFVGIGGFVGLLCLVKWSRSYAMVAHGFLTLFCATLVGLVSYYQSFPYTILLWGPVFAIVSVYLVKGRKGALWTLTLALALGLTIMSASEGDAFGYKIQASQIRSIILFSVGLTMAAALYASILFSNYISKLNQQLAAQNEQLEDNVEEKKLLISIVCHDIANPLNVITFAVAMAEGKKEDDLRNYLATAGRAADQIARIIREVRNLQAVDSGKVALDLEPINLVQTFRQIEPLFAERLQEKQLQLVFKYDNEDELWVEAEEQSLTHSVLSNLVSNAIKFSEVGHSIVVEAVCVDGSVSLTVRDFGIGMPDTIVKNLFKQNKATTRPGTKGEKGTGFGMPITKAFMEKYGGKISVKSSEKRPEGGEHGTTFTLSFRQHRHKRSA